MGLIGAWSATLLLFFFHQANAETGWDEFRRLFTQWLRAPFFPFPTLDAALQHCERLILLAGISYVLLATGRRLLQAFKVECHNIWEKSALSFALGYGAWGTLLFLTGLCGLWSRHILIGTFFVAMALSAVDGRAIYRRWKSFLVDDANRPTNLDMICMVGFGVTWLFILCYALIPETFYDALEYHLALPNIYLLQGRIIPTPENSFSGTPGLPWMLYGWSLAIDSWGILASLLHCSIVLWTAVGCIGLCQRINRRSAGLLSAVSFFLAPVVIGESYRVSVNIEWAFMQLCCLTAYMAVLTNKPGTAMRRSFLLLMGTFLGLAMCTKYPAWLLPIAFCPALFMTYRSNSSNAEPMYALSVRELTLVLAVGAFWLAPWLAKNIWFYKNPIYPFFHELFVPNAAYHPDWRQINAAGTNIPGLLHMSGLIRYAALPPHLLTPQAGITLSIGLFTFCLMPLLMVAHLSNYERVLGWFCLATWIPLSLLSGETRYFIPHLIPLTILLCCIVVRVEPRIMRKIILSGIAYMLVTLSIGWRILSRYPARWNVFRGRIGFSEYLSHDTESYPTPAYAGIEYVNDHTPADSRVLLYGDARGFYFRRSYLASSSDQPSPLELWADDNSSGEALKNRVNQEGISYIVMNVGEIRRLNRTPHTSLQGLKNLNSFWNRYTLREFGVIEPGHRWVGVYKILSDNEAAKPHPVDKLFQFFLDRRIAGLPD